MEFERLAKAGTVAGREFRGEGADLVEADPIERILARVMPQSGFLDGNVLVYEAVDARREARQDCGIADRKQEQRNLPECGASQLRDLDVVLMAVGQGMSEYGDRRCTYARDQKAQRGDGSPVAVDITVLETEEMHVVGRYAQCAGTGDRLLSASRGRYCAGIIGRDNDANVVALGAQQGARAAGTEFQVIGMGRHEDYAAHRFAGTGYRLQKGQIIFRCDG